MVGKKKEDAEKTREELLDAAELVFLQKGVSATSLNDIARAAGVTRGAVYWHFKDKMALFNAMYDRVKLPMDEMFARTVTDENPLESLRQACLFSLRNLQENAHAQRVFTITLHKCELGEGMETICERQRFKRDEVIERSRKVFAAAKKQGLLNHAVEPKTAAHALHAFITGIFNDYLRNPESYDLKKMAPLFLDGFFRGLEA